MPVFAVAGVTGVLLLFASRNYGYFFDEAYFIVAGRDHLAWGYFDQPPLIPFLAGLMDRLFPGSLVALRLPSTLAAAGGVLLTGMIARELGGRRAAQGIAATAYALSGVILLDHYLATYSVDPFFWTLIIFLLVRWTRQRQAGAADDRLLFAAGVATAFSLQTKFLVPALWVAVAACSLIFGPRDLIRRPLLWLGALFAVVATVPTLIWQARNDWPYTRMLEVVANEFPGIGRFLWDGLTGVGLFVGIPLALFGLARLVVARDIAPYRFLGVALVLLVAAFALGSGRPTYVYSLYALPLAAGSVGLQKVSWPLAAKWFGGVLVAVSVLRSLIVVPVYPASWLDKLPAQLPLATGTAKAVEQGDRLLGMLTDIMDSTYQALPPEQRQRTAILTDSYVFAAAIDVSGASRGLPRAYSGHRGYYYFGQPPEQYDSVLFFGTENPVLPSAFAQRLPLTLGPGFTATLYIGRTQTWDQLWPRLRTQ